MENFGVVEVHSGVAFRANIAADQGGAVSLPSNIAFHLRVLLFCDTFARVGLVCWGSGPSFAGRVDGRSPNSGLLVGIASLFVFPLTDSCNQAMMQDGGTLMVHGNVVFEANTAENYGGAVSLPFDIGFTFPSFRLVVCLRGLV